MRIVREEYVNNLTFSEVKEIFANNREWEENGSIGDCYLRFLAGKIGKEITKTDENIVLWMQSLVHECYRMVAEKAMEEGFKF